MDWEETVERRKNKRFLMKQWVFAVRRFPFSTRGRILDISLGGLAFHHVPLSCVDDAVTDQSIQLDICDYESSHELFGIPCRIVYNAPVAEKSPFDEGLVMWRCGVAFEALSADERHQVERLIDKSAIGIF